jgi:hypothetical protein
MPNSGKSENTPVILPPGCEARHETAGDRIAFKIVGDDGNGRGGRLDGSHGRRAYGHDRINLAFNEIGCQRRQFCRVALGRPHQEFHLVGTAIADRAQAFAQRRDPRDGYRRNARIEKANLRRPPRRLPTRSERPCGRSPAERGDEPTPSNACRHLPRIAGAPRALCSRVPCGSAALVRIDQEFLSGGPLAVDRDVGKQ